MAVPTLYQTLIETSPTMSTSTALQQLKATRLTISGSIVCPVPLLQAWEKLTGQCMLECYGMTEAGMILSQTLDKRVPGTVGEPLPSVEVCVEDSGKLLVRGKSLFHGYWRQPLPDCRADGWFETGDLVVKESDGSYRFVGSSER